MEIETSKTQHKKYSLTSECHIFPIEEMNNEQVAYFPLKSLIIKINDTAAELLKKLKNNNTIKTSNKDEIDFLNNLEKMQIINGPDDVIPDFPYYEFPESTDTILFPTFKCNLNCLYCYSNAAESDDDMPFHLAKSAIDTIVENAKKKNKNRITVGFHGGGEPTLNWDVLIRSVEYTKIKCGLENLDYKFSICTNGILSEDKAIFIAENFSDISISLDGPPDIQNFNRPMISGKPSYEYVARTLNILKSRKALYGIRITVTDSSIKNLVETYKFLAENFQPVATAFEPLFFCGRCKTTNCKEPDSDEFIIKMKKVIDLSIKYGIMPRYSGGRIIKLDTRFCGAAGSNFFITPNGLVTSCLEVTRREDPKSDIFIYGSYNDKEKKFNFDLKRYKKLVSLRLQTFNSCKDCFARWHCSGDCIAKNPDVNNIESTRNNYRCKINKALTKYLLYCELKRPELLKNKKRYDNLRKEKIKKEKQIKYV